jgi:peptidoglycan/xylan/chitin deacetylase (PgdA/CDA1 family)
MRKHGFEFGAHTRTHPDLTLIPIEQAESEIVESKLEIQHRLGVEVETFAYPYGKFDPRVKEIVRGQFHGACSTKLGMVAAGDDLSLMKRIDMYYLSDQSLFSKLQTRSLAGYLRVRQSLRELKGFFSKT